MLIFGSSSFLFLLLLLIECIGIVCDNINIKLEKRNYSMFATNYLRGRYSGCSEFGMTNSARECVEYEGWLMW